MSRAHWAHSHLRETKIGISSFTDFFNRKKQQVFKKIGLASAEFTPDIESNAENIEKNNFCLCGCEL